MTGYGNWFPKISDTKFVVKNIAPNKKRIKIFLYPINNGDSRDLLAIPGISEAHIKNSLLQGEILQKLKNNEIIIVDSDIDLLQFNSVQKLFLKNIGISKGIEIDPSVNLTSIKRDNVNLIGIQNYSNLIFSTPDKFVVNNVLNITIYSNGLRLTQSIDFIIAESEGVGTGYDTIIFMLSPPQSDDVLISSYFILNS